MSSKDEAGSPACKKKKTLSDYFSSSVPRKQSTEDTDVPKEVTCNEEIKTAQPSNEQAVQDKTQEEESCAEVEPRPSLIERPYYQPKNFPFPKKTYGKERRFYSCISYISLGDFK